MANSDYKNGQAGARRGSRGGRPSVPVFASNKITERAKCRAADFDRGYETERNRMRGK